MKKLFIKLYSYNSWRYEKIFAALEMKTDVEGFLKEDNKLFFSSVINTLQHNLCGDYIWYGRINNLKEVQIPFKSPQRKIDDQLEGLIQYWKSDDPKVFNSIDIEYQELKILIFDINCKWQEFISKLEDDELERQIKYIDSKGSQRQKILYEILYHLINHHTHHIGQISSVFTQKYGREDYFSIDLIYFK